MQSFRKLQILIFLTILILTGCTNSQQALDSGGTCQSLPFAGVEVELPLIPISVLIDSRGIDFKIEGQIDIDLLVLELEPYIGFDEPGNPVSSCLKVQIRNPEWESGYRRFYVNFNKDNIFRVQVRTDEFTEFVFSKERWIANPPGEQEFVRYEYKTNTLYLDATSGRIEEFTIATELLDNSERYRFCVSELQNRGPEYFVNPFQYIYAFFQDFVNSTREVIFGKFGPFGGGVLIPLIWLAGVVLLLVPLYRLKEKVSKNWIWRSFVVLSLWTSFWITVYNALPACWA